MPSQFTYDWAVTDNPADHSKFKDQPGYVRKLRTDIAERLNRLFYGFTTGDTADGVRRLIFVAQGSAGFSAVTDCVQVFAKDVAGKTELFVIDEDGNTQQITSASKLLASAVKIVGGVAGDLVTFDGTGLSNIAAVAAGKVLISQGTGAPPAYGNITTCPAGAYRNLKLTRASASTVTITADEIFVQDSSGYAFRKASLNVTVDITASGANGLDTGSEGSSRWYYIWVIRKSADGTTACLLSESSSAPTMPSGYDQKALISAVYNDGSSNFIPFIQEGTDYNYTPHREIYTGNLGMGSWTSKDMAPFVPSALSTRPVIGLMGGSANYSAVSNINTAGLTTNVSSPNRWGAGDNQNGDYCEVNIITANTLYFASTDVGNAAYCAGFKINKL